MEEKCSQREALERAAGTTIMELLNALADEILKQPSGQWGNVNFPKEVRYELMRLACSIDDYTFWLHETENGWVLEEIESGYSTDPQPTPQEAYKIYWSGKFTT